MVTAIIPNYNHARFLQRRLESIYNQTYPHLRIILLDDASTDNSRDILEAYRHHPRTQTIVYNNVNSGSPFLQWKKGLDLVETDWVWIAESDDYCALDFLENLQPAFNVSACVLAYAKLSWVNDAGEILWKGVPVHSNWCEGQQFVQENIFGYNMLQNAGMAIFRHSAALAVDARWLSLKQCGDFWFWSEVARQGKVYSCGKLLCYFTRHPASASVANYYTTLEVHEMNLCKEQMLHMGSITKPMLAAQIQQNIMGLYCVKNAFAPKIFKEMLEEWISLAKRNQIPINLAKSRLIAYLEKLKHFTKRKMQNKVPLAGLPNPYNALKEK